MHSYKTLLFQQGELSLLPFTLLKLSTGTLRKIAFCINLESQGSKLNMEIHTDLFNMLKSVVVKAVTSSLSWSHGLVDWFVWYGCGSHITSA